MRRLGSGFLRERHGLLALWGLAVIGCALGFAPPYTGSNFDGHRQAIDLLRIVATTALVIVVLLGPGLVLRAHLGGRLRLGFLPLPGLALMAGTGAVAWAFGLAGWVHPALVSAILVVPVLAGLPVALWRSDQLLAPGEWRVLMLVGGALGIAIGRALWSLDLPGELFAGTIYRTLEVGDRPDSRISFHIIQLIAHGNSPFGAAAASYFSPFHFSDRGPTAALASAPIVMLTGGAPPLTIGAPSWYPFDPQGFMAYRLAMMTMACTCFLALWTLVRRVAGARAAYFALLLAVTTPFLVHEIWFTWPKLLAATFVLLSAVCVIDRRYLSAGLLLGVGYLVHPLALFSLPMLLLLALWPIIRPRLHRPQIKPALFLLIGLAAFLILWRVVNGSHYTQNGFLNYLTQAGSTNTLKGLPVTLGSWLNDRLVSLANTLVPLWLFLFGSHNQEVNSALQPCFPFCTRGSPAIEHFYFQYWNTLPFGFGIVFFPMLLVGVWRAFRRWPWPVIASVVVPFVAFAVYWGGASTGLMREGLQPWVLIVLATVAVEQSVHGFSWLRKPVLRLLLALRALEVLLVAMLPTIWTLHSVVSPRFWLSDRVAVIAMIGFSGFLAVQVLRGVPEHADSPDQRVLLRDDHPAARSVPR